jgi:hypothetical protein
MQIAVKVTVPGKSGKNGKSGEGEGVGGESGKVERGQAGIGENGEGEGEMEMAVTAVVERWSQRWRANHKESEQEAKRVYDIYKQQQELRNQLEDLD